jgi:hypothetical protein
MSWRIINSRVKITQIHFVVKKYSYQLVAGLDRLSRILLKRMIKKIPLTLDLSSPYNGKAGFSIVGVRAIGLSRVSIQEAS